MYGETREDLEGGRRRNKHHRSLKDRCGTRAVAKE
jgi:hypothetical protein